MCQQEVRTGPASMLGTAMAGGEKQQAGPLRVVSAEEVTELRAAGELVFVLDSRVFCVPPSFMHPGGQQVLEKHAGEDISELFRGLHGYHAHSSAARRLLDRFQIGVLAGGVAAEETCSFSDRTAAGAASSCSAGTTAPGTYEIDPTRPLALQVGRLGARYARWVHDPEPGTARFFGSATLEALTKTPWWVVPLLWGPVVALSVAAAAARMASPWAAAAHALLGLLCWQLTEYCVHRFVFHREPSGYWGVTLHFLLHGCHHKFPMDPLRLVFPPLPASAVVAAAYGAAHLVFGGGGEADLVATAAPAAEAAAGAAAGAAASGIGSNGGGSVSSSSSFGLPGALGHHPAALAVFAGWLAGYIAYDTFHYAMHHGRLLAKGGAARAPSAGTASAAGWCAAGWCALAGHLSAMRGKHMDHHFREPERGFGISSDILDVLFGTLPTPRGHAPTAAGGAAPPVVSAAAAATAGSADGSEERADATIRRRAGQHQLLQRG